MQDGKAKFASDQNSGLVQLHLILNHLLFPIWADFLSFCFNGCSKVRRLALTTKMKILSWNFVCGLLLGIAANNFYAVLATLFTEKSLKILLELSCPSYRSPWLIAPPTQNNFNKPTILFSWHKFSHPGPWNKLSFWIHPGKSWKFHLIISAQIFWLKIFQKNQLLFDIISELWKWLPRNDRHFLGGKFLFSLYFPASNVVLYFSRSILHFSAILGYSTTFLPLFQQTLQDTPKTFPLTKMSRLFRFESRPCKWTGDLKHTKDKNGSKQSSKGPAFLWQINCQNYLGIQVVWNFILGVLNE